MTEYPKIQTLYNRNEKTRKVITTQLRLKEFEIPKFWYVTEKIDGTNVRVFYNPAMQTVRFGGKTDNAQMPMNLVEYLQKTLTVEKLSDVFPKEEYDGGEDIDNSSFEIILYGEGYGEKIQSGGNYRKGVSFRLFDVKIGRWWLELESIINIAFRLGIKTVPLLGYMHSLPDSKESLSTFLGTVSEVSVDEVGSGRQAEGVVARTEPLLLMRNGQRLIWKLKLKDFE